MTDKEKFIEIIDKLIEQGLVLDEEATNYFNSLKEKKEKPIITEKGWNILHFMQENNNSYDNKFKAADIGDGIGISGKSVSGSIRKLVTDGFVEKVGSNPVCYSITDLGKTFKYNIEEDN